MKVGISIPESMHTPEEIFAWVQRVDEGPFSTLSVLDRVVYPNYDPLVLLTVAATLTRRVRLMTEVLLAPLRNNTILAKEAATIDNISKGRLTLGLGVGAREDDFTATGTPYKGRGKRFDEQLVQMKRIWSGQPLEENLGLVGPQPVQENGPEIILGGLSPQAYRRVGRFADGFVTPLNDVSQVDKSFRAVEQGWQEAGRSGKPRLIAQIDIGLESQHVGRATEHVLAYYKITPPFDQYKSSTLLRTEQQISEILKALEQIGTDEVVFFTWSTEISQIDRIASLIR